MGGNGDGKRAVVTAFFQNLHKVNKIIKIIKIKNYYSGFCYENNSITIAVFQKICYNSV